MAIRYEYFYSSLFYTPLNEGSRDDLAYFMSMSSMVASEQEEDEG